MDVAGTAVGIASLGVQVCQGLLSYYNDWKDYSSDIATTCDFIERLNTTLTQLQPILNDQDLEVTKRQQAAQTVEDCQKALDKLANKLEKLKKQDLPSDSGQVSRWRQRIIEQLQRSAYPFQKKTLLKLQDIVTTVQTSLDTSLNMLQLDVGISSFRKLNDINVIVGGIEMKIDFTKLPCVKGAAYDSFSEIDEEDAKCLTNTRTDLLEQIRVWARNSSSKSIFWLNGMAGTGKSTIARTLAAEFDSKKQLGASFFFKEGEGDRGTASYLFTTIATQIVRSIPEARPLIAEALENEPNLADKGLRPQFNQLLLHPLQQIKTPTCSLIVMVIDALDECDNEAHVKTIVQLFSELQVIQTISIRIIITSRPELPPRLGFKKITENAYQDFVLHHIERSVIEHDITLFLKHKFGQIRFDHDLSEDWPGTETIKTLTAMATPLFIFAATVCRFVGGSHNPRDHLAYVLQYQDDADLDEIGKTYKPILDRILDKEGRNKALRKLAIQNFQKIVGPIVILADYLSINSLAVLLQLDADEISRQLSPLHSVLDITSDRNRRIRPLHLSFPNYLLDKERQGQDFWIDEKAMHQHLAYKCVELLRSSKLLKQDICDLQNPGVLRSEIEPSTLSRCIPPQLQYACCYWVQHLEKGQCKISDQDQFHLFLDERFLFWLEALSLIGRVSTIIEMVATLQNLVNAGDNPMLADFLRDARRFVMANQYMASFAPSQLYCSSLAFAPQRSVIRSKYTLPKWLVRYPLTETWNATLQTLESHSDYVNSVTFSPDGKLLASASDDSTVKIWDAITGSLQQTLESHSGSVYSVAFSPDGKQLASASNDKTVKIWDVATGSLQQTLESHLDWVRSVTFSPNGKQLASASYDSTVKIWDVATGLGSLQQTLEAHSDLVNSVTFSPDGKLLASASYDSTVKIWDAATGSLQQTLESHSCPVSSVAFSPPDGKVLASASHDKTVKIWDVATGSLQQTIQIKNSIYDISFHPSLAILNTSGGQIAIERQGTEDQIVGGTSANISTIDNLYVKQDWIMNGNQKTLWLPLEYRPRTHASNEQTLAFGYSSGRVMFFEFSFKE